MSSSETLLSTQTHPGDGSTQTVTGDKFKGDGYYSRSDGLHTVQLDLNGFIGTIEIEATLSLDPDNPLCDPGTDWFPIQTEVCVCCDTTGCVRTTEEPLSLEYTTATTTVYTFNFTGNYVWIRAKVTNWTDGTINHIKLNH